MESAPVRTGVKNFSGTSWMEGCGRPPRPKRRHGLYTHPRTRSEPVIAFKRPQKMRLRRAGFETLRETASRHRRDTHAGEPRLGDESFDFNNSFGQDDDFMNESIGSRGLQDFGDLRDPSDLSMDRSPASLDTFDMPNAFDLVAQQSATVFRAVAINGKAALPAGPENATAVVA